MKKTLALLLAAVMLLSVLAACSSKAETPAEPEQTTEEPAQTPDAPAEETTEETTAAEEPSQEELDQAAADEVAAMIDAIYVQTRTNETDAQCEAAKAAWDALTDAQKALVEGDEASPDYFGLDTGDASKDDPRNQDDIGENELLVVSFGTSFNDSRVADIKGIEDALQEANPDWSVRRAFTAQIIINHIQARDGEKIDNMTQALDRAVANGVKNLVVQPTHLMHGAEYDEMCDNGTISALPDCFQAFRSRYNRDHNIIDVRAVSAVPMTEAQTKRLREKLEAKCKKHVELTVQTDPTLLGGIRLELPDRQLDGSVQSHLSQIQQLLESSAL